MASNFNTTDPYGTGLSNVNNANSQGQSAVGSFDPNAWQQNTQSGLNDITKSQAAGNNDVVNAFKSQIANQPSATGYYNAGMNAFNVPALQQNANNLNAAVLNAPNSNLAAGRGFNVDQNQVDQKTSQDLQRLEPAAQAAQGYANTAQQNALAYQNAGLQQNTMNMMPLQAQQQMQADLYARQFSGFTATAQAQLASLQAKMQAGVQLSTAEMSAFSQLTTAESNYQSSLATANAGVQAEQIKASNQIVPQGGTYFNPGTQGYYTPNVGSGKLGA